MDINLDRPFQLNDWHVDPTLDCISRDGVTVSLDQRQMQVLLLLAKHAGEIVGARRIEDTIWVDAAMTPNALHQCITQLRRALGDDTKNPKYIQTVARRGYRLIARVRAAESALPDIGDQQPVAETAPIAAGQTASSHPAIHPLAAMRRQIVSLLKSRPMLGWKTILMIAAALILIGAVYIRASLESERAARESGHADQISAFMLNVFSSGNNTASGNGAVTAKELIQPAVQRVTTDLAQQPLMRAQMLEAIAISYSHSDAHARAIAPLQDALRIRRTLGSQPEIVATLMELGSALRELFRLDESEQALAEALQIQRLISGEHGRDYAMILCELGYIQLDRGNTGKSLRLLNQSVELMRAAMGPRHSEVGTVLAIIAGVHTRNGDVVTAERSIREALAILRASLPELNPKIIGARNLLGEILTSQGRLEEATVELQAALSTQKKLFGSEDVRYAAGLDNLSNVRFSQERFAEASELIREALGILVRLGKPVVAERANVQVHLARQLWVTQDFVRSEALLRDSIELYESSSSDPQGEAGAEYWLGELLLKQARPAEAEVVLTATVERSRRAQMVEWRINRCLNSLGEALYRQGRAERGRQMIIESHRKLFSMTPQKAEANKRATERMQWLRGMDRAASRK